MDERLIRAERNLLPKEKDLATPKQIEKETSVSQRVQQKMAKMGIIPRPIRFGEGRQTFYNKTFIKEELSAIAMFRTAFLCSLEDLAEIALHNKDKYFKDLILDLESHLHYINENSRGKKQGGDLIWEIGSNKLLNSFAKGYIKKLKTGLPKKLDFKDYIELIEYFTEDKG